jgi:hypothetical protein
MPVSVDLSVSIGLDPEAELLNFLPDQEAMETLVREGLDQELIITPTRRAIYNYALFHYRSTGNVLTREALTTEYPNADFGEPRSDIHWVINRLRWRYKRNEIESLSLELSKLIDDPDEGQLLLRAKSAELDRRTTTQKYIYGMEDWPDFLTELQADITAGNFKGVTTGWEPVDKFTGGLKPGFLAFICARPKMQKTFNMIKAFVEQTKAGEKPALFTIENTAKEIRLRIACLLSGYSWDQAHRGDIGPGDWKVLKASFEEFMGYGEHWILAPPVGERTVPSMMLQADRLGAESILISQFKYIEAVDKHNAQHEKYAQNVIDLKQAAIRQGQERPIYVEAQFNRDAKNLKEIDAANLGQLGLTDQIGQAADIVFGLARSKDEQEMGLTQFGIIAARNSGTASWHFQSEFREETRMKMNDTTILFD